MVYIPCHRDQMPSWDEFVVFEKTQALPRFSIELASDGLYHPQINPRPIPSYQAAASSSAPASSYSGSSILALSSASSSPQSPSSNTTGTKLWNFNFEMILAKKDQKHMNGTPAEKAWWNYLVAHMKYLQIINEDNIYKKFGNKISGSKETLSASQYEYLKKAMDLGHPKALLRYQGKPWGDSPTLKEQEELFGPFRKPVAILPRKK